MIHVQRGAAPTEREVAAALEWVRSRPEFAERARSPLARALDWLSERLGGLALPESLGGALGTVVLAVILIALAASIALLLRAAARRAREDAPEHGLAGRRRRAAELRAEADRARGSGDLARALRLYLFALVVGLGRRGELEYRDAWTNRELLERGQPSAEVRAELGPLVRELDRKLFGGEPSTAEDVEHLAALCERFLGPPGPEVAA